MADKKTGAGEHPKAAAVRKAATALADAIGEARAAGFAVDFPSRVDGLPSIIISETGRVTDGEATDSLTGTQVGTAEVGTGTAS